MSSSIRNDRLRALRRIIPFALFVVISTSIFGWFLQLKFAEAQAEQKLAARQAVEKVKRELQLEKEELIEEIEAQKQVENSKLKRIEKACSVFFSLDEFPVRSGEHLVFCDSLIPNGMRALFFLPAGAHRLDYRIDEEHVPRSGISASPVSYGGGGVGMFLMKDLPTNSVLQLTFELKNDEHECLATVELRNEREVLFQESYKYPKRTLNGAFQGDFFWGNILEPGHGGWGGNILRPGQIVKHGMTDRYCSHAFEISPNAESTHWLEFIYRVDSPEAPIFLRANDVYRELERAAYGTEEFESNFEADDGTGRLFKFTSD